MPLWPHLRNVFSGYAQVASAALVAFILTPLLFHHLGPTNYAILALAIIVEALLETSDLGMTWALVRYVSNFSARRWDFENRQLGSSAFLFLIGLGTLYSALLALLSPSLANFFHVNGSANAPGSRVIALVGFSLVFQLPSGGLRGMLLGRQDFHLANAVDVFFQWTRGGALLFALLLGGDLITLSALFPVLALLRLVGLLLVSHGSRFAFRPRLAEVNFESLRQIQNFASLSFLQDLADRLFGHSDTFIAAKLLPLPQLSILVIARRLPQALYTLTHQSLSIAYPIVSSADARHHEQAQRYLFLLTRNVSAMVIPLAAFMYVWAGVILHLWVGPEVLSGLPVFRAYVGCAVFGALSEVPFVILYGLGHIRFSATLSVSLFVGSLLLGAWACSRAGLVALAESFAGAQALRTVLLFGKAFQLTSANPAQWFKKAVLPVLLPALPTFGWLWVTYTFLPRTVLGLLVSALTSLLVFTITFARLVTGSGDQAWKVRLKRLLVEI
jgi:O-antigen/teichoic acid export membrane protein